jgi:hypothetical protein
MRPSRNPNEISVASSLQAVGLLVLLCIALAILGYLAEPADASPCGVAPQVVAPQVLPSFPSYTATPFYSSTLNFVGQDQRALAVAQWQLENAALMAQVQQLLAQQAAQQQAPAQPGWQAPAMTPGPLPQPQAAAPPAQCHPQAAPQGQASGRPPYAWSGATPVIVKWCGSCHTDGYTPEGGPAGGVFLDGSTDLRADANWQVREQINEALADQRMPPDGNAVSGEVAGKIFLELYKGRSAGGAIPPEAPQ